MEETAEQLNESSKLLVYNKYLPYANQIEGEAAILLRDIISNLSISVQLREFRPGIVHWTSRLIYYIQLYGRNFTKDEHVGLINLYLNLITIPDLDLSLVLVFSKALTTLLRKKSLLSRDDLVIQWRPLYELVERVLYSPYEPLGLEWTPQYIEYDLKKLIEHTRVYFSVESTQEMLDEFRPLLCPFDEAMHKGISYFEMFLPTSLPPEHHDKGFKLWLDEVLNWLDVCHNNPSWAFVVVELLARVASWNIGYIDWSAFIPKFFTRFLRMFNLPVGSKKLQIGRAGKGYNLHSSCLLIISMLGPKTDCQEYLQKFFSAIESYFHPSNIGKYTLKLQKVLSELPSLLISRLHRERYKKATWQHPVREDYKLTDENITAFVNSIKQCAFLAIYSKIGSLDAAIALKQLALVRPELVIPTVLDKTYQALDTLTEPHQLTATLNCFVGIARSLLRGGKKLPDGPSHLIPLLHAILPGIDPNDQMKFMVTMQMINTAAMLAPFVDCSQAHLVRNDLTVVESELCSATASLEDFVLQFLDRCFAVVEANVMEHGASNHTKVNAHDALIGAAMSATLYAVLTQCSTSIFEAALNKLARFVKESVLEVKVGGKMLATMCKEAARVNPSLTLKKLLPHCCQIILSSLSAEGVQEEEHLDNEVLFNLLIVSEITASSFHEIMNYKEMIFEVLQASLHLTCKDGYEIACSLLKGFLESLSMTCIKERRSIPEDFDRPLEEYLPIRDYAKDGSLDNINIKWNTPTAESAEVVKETFDRFLQPEMEKLQSIIRGEEMNRDKVLQRLKIMYHCLLGSASLLPMWRKPAIKDLLDTKVPTCRHHVMSVAPELTANFKDQREEVCGVMHALLDHILSTGEDDTKTLQLIINILTTLLWFHGATRQRVEAKKKAHAMVKRSVDDRVHGKKHHVRGILVERIHLQHQIRCIKNKNRLYSELDRQIMKDFFRLSISRYSEVRKRAQEALMYSQNHFPGSKVDLIAQVLTNLKNTPEVEHHQFKGALYLLLGNNQHTQASWMDWSLLKDCWLALVQAGHSEKPSIMKLIDQITQKVNKTYCTFAIRQRVTEGCISQARALLSSSSGDLSSCLLNDKELQQSQECEDKKNGENLSTYYSLINSLADLLDTGTLRWKFSQMAVGFLALQLRKDVSLSPKVTKLLTSYLINETLNIRKLSITTVGCILKQQKRSHKKIMYDPYSISGTSVPSGSIPAGDRPDNMWHRYDTNNLPLTQEAWDKCTFVEKTHWGYNQWPKEMKTYAPESEQPKLDRSRSELSELEQMVYDQFADETFVAKLIKYYSLEEKKEKDKFSNRRYVMFKGLFRNFGDSFLPAFKPHLEKLAGDSQESSQRCLAEIVAGLIQGSKHWGFQKTKALWEMLLPILDKAFINMGPETLKDWSISLSSACESRDPRRLTWLFEWLIDNPIRGEGGSFLDSSRISILKNCLAQQEWRIPCILHRMLTYLESNLTHSYRNVRDSIGSCITWLLVFDIPMGPNMKTASPHLDTFLDQIIPKLDPLKDFENWAPYLGASVDELGEEKGATIRLLKTVMKWMRDALGRMLRPVPSQIYKFLPLLTPLERCEADEELRHEVELTLACMAQTLIQPEAIHLCLEPMKEIACGSSWKAKCSMLAYLQVMVYNNLFVILSRRDCVQTIQDLVEELLTDERLEVREIAGVTLSGLIHCKFLSLDTKLQSHFEKLCKTALPKKSKNVRLVPVDAGGNDAIVLRHAGILGLSAYVQAYPYEVPEWMPQILMDLTGHLHDPQPIEMTVRKTLSDFRRTHHDNWHEHKQQFTDDQLVVLTDLLVSPCYYA